MTRETEFALTLNLPCSAGILAYDIETRVTISYEAYGRGEDLTIEGWGLEDVRLDGEPGVIRKKDRLFWLFEEAVKPHEETIIRECLNHAEDSARPDPDDARDRVFERDIAERYFEPAANLLGVSA